LGVDIIAEVCMFCMEKFLYLSVFVEGVDINVAADSAFIERGFKIFSLAGFAEMGK
jgi:hypothetical protein